jgi:RNA polymerase sigma factor (TIGR02999 family)
MSPVTRIIADMNRGDPSAAERLLPLVYKELRKLAASKMAHESPGQTLDATALVHEAYLRLVDQDIAPHWDSRGHFFAAAAEAMRRILIERARRRSAAKHGGKFHRLDIDSLTVADERRSEELLALNDALSELERHDAKAAQLVKLRYFAGVSHRDAAEAMRITRRQADRLWALARAWLYQRMAQ